MRSYWMRIRKTAYLMVMPSEKSNLFHKNHKVVLTKRVLKK
jgi:hypothetical protein